jgi:hypothetical protein
MRTSFKKLSACGMLVLAACAAFVATQPASAQTPKRFGPIIMGSGQTAVIVPPVAAGTRFVVTHIYVIGDSANVGNPLTRATCDGELVHIDTSLKGSPVVSELVFFIPVLTFDDGLGGNFPLTFPLEATEGFNVTCFGAGGGSTNSYQFKVTVAGQTEVVPPPDPTP